LNMADSDFCRRAAGWLATVQNADGGFGETCESYGDPAQKGHGPSTPSQTAWALIGLISAPSAPVQQLDDAVRYLIDSQNASGSWDELATTGTGFPRVFYLKYHLYRHSFPLSALARYRASLTEREDLNTVVQQSGLA